MVFNSYSIVPLHNFVLCPETPGAKIKAFLLAVYNNIGRMNIWRPAVIGVPLGVAYIMTELRSLTAQVALHSRTPF